MGRWQGADRISFTLLSGITLIFQGHNPIKSLFWPYLISCFTNYHQILPQGSMGQGLLANQKYHKQLRCTQTRYIGHHFPKKGL